MCRFHSFPGSGLKILNRPSEMKMVWSTLRMWESRRRIQETWKQWRVFQLYFFIRGWGGVEGTLFKFVLGGKKIFSVFCKSQGSKKIRAPCAHEWLEWLLKHRCTKTETQIRGCWWFLIIYGQGVLWVEKKINKWPLCIFNLWF